MPIPKVRATVRHLRSQAESPFGLPVNLAHPFSVDRLKGVSSWPRVEDHGATRPKKIVYEGFERLA